MNQHPNASAAGGTTALAALALYVGHRLGWNGLSSEDAILGAGAAISVVLFVGRRGLVPTVKAILFGSSKPPPVAAVPPPARMPPPAA